MTDSDSDTAASATYMYTIRPTRPDIRETGPTEAEAAVVGRHFEHLQRLVEQGIGIVVGRTLALTGDDNYGIVVFRADSEEAARTTMQSDPGVQEGLFDATLVPFEVLLLGQA